MSKDGGPAFPSGVGRIVYDHESDTAETTVPSGEAGMSLRDWFACHAPDHRADFQSPSHAREFVGPEAADPEESMESLARLAAQVQAKLAYMYADAMLKARDRG